MRRSILNAFASESFSPRQSYRPGKKYSRRGPVHREGRRGAPENRGDLKGTDRNAHKLARLICYCFLQDMVNVLGKENIVYQALLRERRFQRELDAVRTLYPEFVSHS